MSGFDHNKLVIYAWVGEDELGSGVIGIKQGRTAAGMIPLAAMGHHLDRMLRCKPGMEEQAAKYGKKIRLVRFEAVSIEKETEAGS